MATETQTAPPKAPELTVLARVASIPLISSSLETIHSTLSNNAYTKSPYTTAQGLSQSAYSYTVPLQARLAPILTSADGYANKGLDAVESRYPYPFKAKPDEVASYVRERRQSTVDAANQTINDKVTSPVLGVAQGIDSRFAPIVDYFEVQVNKLNGEAGPSVPPTDSKYQYQRAYNLSRNLTGNLYVYSNEQLKQLQAQNSLVHKATETAQSITAIASSSYTNAQTRIHGLSDKMLAELQKVQATTASLPQSLQSTFPDLSATITDLRNIITQKDLPLNEKVNKVGQEVKDRVNPLLDVVSNRIKELLGVATAKKEDVKDKLVNGST